MNKKNIDELYYQRLDMISEMAVINLYSLSKEDTIIKLYDFSQKNKKHLCLFALAQNLSSVSHFSIELEMPLYEYVLFKARYGLFFNKNIRYINKKHNNICTCNSIIQDLEDTNEDYSNIFETIYDEYYKETFERKWYDRIIHRRRNK